MKVLVTGSKGQLGSTLVEFLENKNIRVQPANKEDLDITAKESVRKFISEAKPSLIVNCAAYTDVEKAEDERDKAFAVNAESLKIISEVIEKLDIPIIHISTDYVFDGAKEGSYTEDDQALPASVYGKSKLIGEEILKENLKKYIILRTSWVFSEFGACFSNKIFDLAKKEKFLRIIDDQIGSPTSVNLLCHVIIMIIKRIKNGSVNWGTYNISQKPYVSWFDFAKFIIDICKDQKIINDDFQIFACATSEMSFKAIRPFNSKLDTSKFEKEYDFEIYSWKKDIEKFFLKKS